MAKTLCDCGHEQYHYRILERDGVRILSKDVEGSRHFLRKNNAWGIQSSVLVYHLERGDVALLEINDTEKGVRYQTSIDIAFRSEQVFYGVDYGLQFAVPLSVWVKSPSDTYQMAMF